jgi:hypothetical protein
MERLILAGLRIYGAGVDAAAGIGSFVKSCIAF